jgi:hypothetical protein
MIVPVSSLLQLTTNLATHFAQAIDTNSLPHPPTTNAELATILSIVFGILGAAAVVMVTIGGIQYAGSQGDPQGTAKAKNTIVYALVGVIIAIFAETIIKFTIGKVFQ